jgi:hypothetical protein
VACSLAAVQKRHETTGILTANDNKGKFPAQIFAKKKLPCFSNKNIGQNAQIRIPKNTE